MSHIVWMLFVFPANGGVCGRWDETDPSRSPAVLLQTEGQREEPQALRPARRPGVQPGERLLLVSGENVMAPLTLMTCSVVYFHSSEATAGVSSYIVLCSVVSLRCVPYVNCLKYSDVVMLASSCRWWYSWSPYSVAWRSHSYWWSRISPPSPSTEEWCRRRGCHGISSSKTSRGGF